MKNKYSIPENMKEKIELIIKEIEKFCDENGITLETKAVETNDYAENTIISQSRQAGIKVVSGVTLRVTYAVKKEEKKDTTTSDKTTTDSNKTNNTKEDNSETKTES